MSFYIRLMQTRDLDAVLDLAARSGEVPLWTRHDYEQVLPPVSVLPSSASAALSLCAASWVALKDRTLVGFAVACWLRGESAAEIENLLVERECRRQGIGTALIKACMEWAAHTGAAAVRLEVRESNSVAHALYRGLGFVSIGRRRAYYASPAEDAFIFEAPAVIRGPNG